MKFIDLTGQKFGKLIIIKRTDNDKFQNTRWLYKCDCGKMGIVLGDSIKSGKTQSCGCLRKMITQRTGLNNMRHGHTQNKKPSQIYISWRNMKIRCINPTDKAYLNYGGRGIKVCKRWLQFKNFNEDMGKDWKSGLQIERKNNHKGYYKENCKWATSQEQARNRRDNHLRTYCGRIQTIAELADKAKIPYGVLFDRINRLGWSLGRAMTTPVRKWRKQK